MQKDSLEQGTVVGGRGRRYRMGRWGIRDLDMRWGESTALAEGGQIPQWRYTCRRSSRRESQCFGRGQLQESELPRALNVDKESCEHLRWTHLEQAQHCTDLPRQVTFPAHTEQGKMGPVLG